MGISGSVERKSPSLKTRSPDVAASGGQPCQNGTLVVVSPPTTSSTPSSPNRYVGMRRNRSYSSDAGMSTNAAEKATDADDDGADNNVNGGGESIGFSLAELACYCSTENQLPGGEPSCKSRDHDDTTAEMTSTFDKKPLQVCGVKPPTLEQTAVDESLRGSTVEPRKSESSSHGSTLQQVNSGDGTRTKMRPRFSDIKTRRPSDAITDITQAKRLTHQAVEARKTPHRAGDCKMAQKQQSTTSTATTPPPNDTSSKSVSAAKSQQSTGRGNSGRGSRAKPPSTSAEEHVTVDRSEKTSATRQHEDKPGANPATRPVDELEPPQPEMKVVVRSKPATGAAPPASNVKQKSTWNTSQKSVPQKAQPPQPVIAVNDDDDDDDDDWENLITALRDPDDIRNRKSVPRRGSNMNLWGGGKGAKPTKEEKQNTTEDDEEEEEEEVNDVGYNVIHQNHHKLATVFRCSDLSCKFNPFIAILKPPSKATDHHIAIQ